MYVLLEAVCRKLAKIKGRVKEPIEAQIRTSSKSYWLSSHQRNALDFVFDSLTAGSLERRGYLKDST